MLTSSRRRSRVQHEYISQHLSELRLACGSENIDLSYESTNGGQKEALPNLTRQRLSSNPVHQAGLNHLLNEAIRQRASIREYPDPTKSSDQDGHSRLVVKYDPDNSHGFESPTPTVTVWGARRMMAGSGTKVLESRRWSSIFGTITTTKRSRRPTEENDAERDSFFSSSVEETQTSIVIHPSPWLVSIGIKYEAHTSMSWSLNGWRLMQQAWRIIPSSSSIFIACREGDLNTVRELLSRREASIWDISEDGMSPLHVSGSGIYTGDPDLVFEVSNSYQFAAEEYQTEVCKFLIESGARWKRDASNLYLFPVIVASCIN